MASTITEESPYLHFQRASMSTFWQIVEYRRGQLQLQPKTGRCRHKAAIGNSVMIFGIVSSVLACCFRAANLRCRQIVSNLTRETRVGSPCTPILCTSELTGRRCADRLSGLCYRLAFFRRWSAGFIGEHSKRSIWFNKPAWLDGVSV